MKIYPMLLLLFVAFFNNIYANEIVLQGIVRSQENQTIDFYTIDVFDVENDTIIIAQECFSDTLFRIKAPLKEKLLLHVFGYGFEPIIQEVLVTESSFMDVGVIAFQTKDIILDELVVTARQPVFQMQGSKILVNVQNSTLQEVGNAHDVLNHIPGIRTVNGEYNIWGRGVPDIYIDGKQIQTQNALALLKSDNIAEITIDRNPSAVYNAQTNSVILITTKKKIQDILGGSIQNISSLYRRYSNSSVASMNWKKGIVSADLSYIYSIGNSLLYESSYRYIHNDNSTFFSDLDYTNEFKSIEHDIQIRIAVDLNEKNRIGIQYDSALSPKDINLYHKKQTIEENNPIEHRLIEQNIEKAVNEQQISANYIYRQNENTELSFILDYIYKNADQNSTIFEQNQMSGAKNDTYLLSGNSYKVYTGTVNYKFMIFNKFKSIAGMRYAQINNHTRNCFNISLENNNSMENLTDRIGAIFLQTNGVWNEFSVNAGLRYEYDKMEIVDFYDSRRMTERNFSSFFPSLSFEYKPIEKAVFELNYSKKIARPSFFQLNSNIFYEDSLSYISGNKDILPTDINRLSFNVTFWQKLLLECNYTHYANKIIQTEISDSNVPNKIWSIPINIKRTNLFSGLLSYFFSYKSWSANCMVMTEIPRLTIPYLDEEIKINQPIWTFSFNNELTLFERFYLYENFNYSTAGYDHLTYKYSINNLTIGLLAKFLKNKLIVGIEATDLLDGSNWNNWDKSYLNIQSGCRGSYDSRGLHISINYKFNTIKSNVNIKKGNTDIINRMY